jgi:hypothetical protein
MLILIKNVIPIFILAAAVKQWFGIGERTYHAWWMWYKFKNYGGGGRTDLSIEMTIITYALSFFLIASGFLIRRYWKLSKLSDRINVVAVSMLLIGIGWLSLLLASPFAVIVKR